jgi:hypothetical protein
VALAPLAGVTVVIGWLPVSPSTPHPVKKDMIERRRPATMAGRRSGMRAVSVTLVRSKKYRCSVKSLMCCSREVGMVALIQARSTSCAMLGKKINTIEEGAKHVPWCHVATT